MPDQQPIPPAVVSWSGGKDSALALHRTLQNKTHDVRALITTVTDEYDRISMHGVRRDLLEAQAAAIGIPLTIARIPPRANNDIYEEAMRRVLMPFSEQGITDIICGDLFLQDIREYRERLFGSIGMRAVFPLWLEDTARLAHEFIQSGFKAVVCCANPNRVAPEVCGSDFNDQLLERLPTDCDPCAENGEFHTFVYAGPIFRYPLKITRADSITRDGFCFTDLIEETRAA